MNAPTIAGRQAEAHEKSTATRLRDLTGVVHDGLDPAAKQALFTERRSPRAKDKPVIRG